MIKLLKPKFWDNKNKIFSIILLPISALIQLLLKFKKKISVAKKFNIPIICVGNIYIGGTGKTPASIFLAKELSALGHRPVIIRKYYNNHKDEHDLIKANFSNLILDAKTSVY